MGRLERIYGYFEYVKKVGVFLSGVAIFGMILIITLDVLSRNFFHSSIPGSYEMVRNYLMTLAAFPIILYAYSSGIMPRISMVIDKFPLSIQKVVHIITLLFELLIVAFVAFYSFGYALTGTESNYAFPAAGNLFPIYPFLYLVPFGFAFIGVEIILLLLKNCLSKHLWITFNKQQEQQKDQELPYVS